MTDASPGFEASRTWRVAESETGDRLDKHVAGKLDVPRHQVQQWIRDGRVAIERRGRRVKAKPSSTLEALDQLSCRVPEPEPDATLVPEDKPLTVLFADEHLVVLDKPSGLAVHPGAGRPHGTLVHRLVHHFPEIATVGGTGRPGIVHRLDLDTTGVMVVARSQVSYRRLSEAFSSRELGKIYLALVHGVPNPEESTIDRPIGRHPKDRKRMAIRAEGRPSITRFETLDSVEKGAALLRIRLETGRTHQIRVHMKAAGHPLIGDPIYGEARWRGAPRTLQKRLARFGRPALHAWRLELTHPVTREPMRFEASIPHDLVELWRGLSGKAEALAALDA